YTHQYNYFNGGLKIAEHPDPWTYVLASDEWHTWGDGWTMAPLYHLFVGLVFRRLGPHLRTLQVLQCLLDAATAVMLGALGRAVAAPSLPLAALWRWRVRGGKAGRAEAAAILVAGAAAILPWTVRNALVIGDPVLIETVGIWNVWTDNAFVDPHVYDVQA